MTKLNIKNWPQNMAWYWLDKWNFLNKKINLKKPQNNTDMISAWHMDIVLNKKNNFLKIKINKINDKMTCGSYCSYSVNYFNDISKNDKIE